MVFARLPFRWMQRWSHLFSVRDFLWTGHTFLPPVLWNGRGGKFPLGQVLPLHRSSPHARVPGVWDRKELRGKCLLSLLCKMIPSRIVSGRNAAVFLTIPCGGTTPMSGPRLSCSPPGNHSSPACSRLSVVHRSRSTPSCKEERGEEIKWGGEGRDKNFLVEMTLPHY